MYELFGGSRPAPGRGHAGPAVCSPRGAPCMADSHCSGAEVVPLGHSHAPMTSSWGIVRKAAPEMPTFKPKAWEGASR